MFCWFKVICFIHLKVTTVLLKIRQHSDLSRLGEQLTPFKLYVGLNEMKAHLLGKHN